MQTSGALTVLTGSCMCYILSTYHFDSLIMLSGFRLLGVFLVLPLQSLVSIYFWIPIILLKPARFVGTLNYLYLIVVMGKCIVMLSNQITTLPDNNNETWTIMKTLTSLLIDFQTMNGNRWTHGRQEKCKNTNSMIYNIMSVFMFCCSRDITGIFL